MINKLIKDENVTLLDIVFSHLKFYDNCFILQLLFHYKNKTAITTSNLNQQVSNEKFIILINTKYNITNTSNNNMKNINLMNVIKNT